MFSELPQTLILLTAGAFLFGWILSAISSRIRSRYQTKARDTRDDRIRSLEAELRIAQTDRDNYQGELSRLDERLKEIDVGIERRDGVITKQQEKLEATTQKLKDSVIKTRELRRELADRAAETVHAEARIREVQTELSVAQASQEMLATGVLDYNSITSEDEPEDTDEPKRRRGMQGLAS